MTIACILFIYFFFCSKQQPWMDVSSWRSTIRNDVEIQVWHTRINKEQKTTNELKKTDAAYTHTHTPMACRVKWRANRRFITPRLLRSFCFVWRFHRVSAFFFMSLLRHTAVLFIFFFWRALLSARSALNKKRREKRAFITVLHILNRFNRSCILAHFRQTPFLAISTLLVMSFLHGCFVSWCLVEWRPLSDMPFNFIHQWFTWHSIVCCHFMKHMHRILSHWK